MNPILKSGVRILRPTEYESLREAIPKLHHRLIVEALLFTGMRWVELVRFKDNPAWYDSQGGYIYLPPEASRKKERTMRDRYIYLSAQGRGVIPMFLKVREKIPSRIAMNENLKRWAVAGGIDPIGISVKTFRKTWESWLMASFPDKALLIAMSQGHTQLTAMNHYLNLPFSPQDMERIRSYTQGWGP